MITILLLLLTTIMYPLAFNNDNVPETDSQNA